jgi:hypothetical protein
VVFFGSPGVGTDDVRDLGIRPGHVLIVEARRDPVAGLASFGADPNQLDGVVGLPAPREILDGVERTERLGNTCHLTDDTASQYGIPAVVTGVPDRAPSDDGAGGGDIVGRVIPVLLRASGISP